MSPTPDDRYAWRGMAPADAMRQLRGDDADILQLLELLQMFRSMAGEGDSGEFQRRLMAEAGTPVSPSYPGYSVEQRARYGPQLFSQYGGGVPQLDNMNATTSLASALRRWMETQQAPGGGGGSGAR